MSLYIKKNKHTSILQNSNSKIYEYDENVYKNYAMIQSDADGSFRSSPFQKFLSNSKYNAALHNSWIGVNSWIGFLFLFLLFLKKKILFTIIVQKWMIGFVYSGLHKIL